MSTSLIVHVDAFTTEAFAGNSAGVVLNADGLPERTMQLIARALRHSETAFVLSSDSPTHDVRLRYFTPTVEVPICGHATIAAHAARAAVLGVKPGRYTQKTKAGLHLIDIEDHDHGHRVWLHQGSPRFENPLPAPIAEEIIDALGIEADELWNTLPVQVVSTGHSKVMIPLTVSADRLDALTPDLPRLAAVSTAIGCNGFYPFRMRSEHASEGRMFAPAIGIDEDPVTGNANGPLGAYLAHHGVLKGDAVIRFQGHQGRALGRPGIVHVRISMPSNARPYSVSIGGDAKLLFCGKLATLSENITLK